MTAEPIKPIVDGKQKACNSALSKSINACLNNGKRLMEEAEWHSYEPSPTSFALTVLAEEEFAKAFMLTLVREDALPWIPEVRRSLSNHECKHLIGIVIDWLYTPSEEALKRLSAPPGSIIRKLTNDAANALNIYRHEKIEMFRRGWYSKETEWDGYARKIAGGLLDREKQSSFYVSIGVDGTIASVPHIKGIKLKKEMQRAERFKELAEDVYSKSFVTLLPEYEFIIDVLKAIFADLALRNDEANSTP